MGKLERINEKIKQQVEEVPTKKNDIEKKLMLNKND